MSNPGELEMQLHARLLAGDPVASEEVARRFLEPVRRHVGFRARAHGVFDLDLINDAAVDAVFDYIRHPTKFSPMRSSLSTYLNLAAERDLINAVRKDRRRRKGEELSPDVELAIFAGNKESDIQKIRRNLQDAVPDPIADNNSVDEMVATVRSGEDRHLVRMMLEGERRTSAFAEVLGISNLSISKQRRLVKQHKDRLKQQLKRGGGKRRG